MHNAQSLNPTTKVSKIRIETGEDSLPPSPVSPYDDEIWEILAGTIRFVFGNNSNVAVSPSKNRFPISLYPFLLFFYDMLFSSSFEM